MAQYSFRVVTATIAPGIPTVNRPARLPNGITGEMFLKRQFCPDGMN